MPVTVFYFVGHFAYRWAYLIFRPKVVPVSNLGLRVLLTSGYPLVKLEKFGVGASDFKLLKKPYSIEELSEAVHSVLVEG